MRCVRVWGKGSSSGPWCPRLPQPPLQLLTVVPGTSRDGRLLYPGGSLPHSNNSTGAPQFLFSGSVFKTQNAVLGLWTRSSGLQFHNLYFETVGRGFPGLGESTNCSAVGRSGAELVPSPYNSCGCSAGNNPAVVRQDQADTVKAEPRCLWRAVCQQVLGLGPLFARLTSHCSGPFLRGFWRGRGAVAWGHHPVLAAPHLP